MLGKTSGAPNGIRIRAAGLKGRCPRPLDDGGTQVPPGDYISRPRSAAPVCQGRGGGGPVKSAATVASSTCGATCARVAALRSSPPDRVLRELLLSNNDGRSANPTAPAVLNGVAARVGLRLRVGADGLARLEVEGTGADGALGRLLVVVYRAMESGDWWRLKACRNDTCRWAFFDRSKNQSRHWCSMEVCGSRYKAHEYRERHKAARASAVSPAAPPGGR